MREESEKFRKWKAENERAMLRLRNEDRKRATAMAKMESLHAKQQNVLKRKMEEAVAVNKRLKASSRKYCMQFREKVSESLRIPQSRKIGIETRFKICWESCCVNVVCILRILNFFF